MKSLKLKRNPGEHGYRTCYHNIGRDDKARAARRGAAIQSQFLSGFVQQGSDPDQQEGDGQRCRRWEELLRTNPNFPQRAELEVQIRQYRASGP
jgi:hypothetical protein